MKSKTAKGILAESLREVAETNQIDKITIRDIVDNCCYGKKCEFIKEGTVRQGKMVSVYCDYNIYGTLQTHTYSHTT